MKPRHQEIIRRYRGIERQVKADDCSLISWVFRSSPAKMIDALSLPSEARKWVADSYREGLTRSDLIPLREERVGFVRAWKARRYFRRVCAILTPLAVAVVLNGVVRDRDTWSFCSENMLDRRMLWLVILSLAALAIPLRGLVLRFFGKRMDTLSIFSLLLIVVCLLELVALF